MPRLSKTNQLGFVFLLCRNAEDAGVTDLLGAQLLEERIGAVGGPDHFTALEGHPLSLKSSEYLG
jgi:hypothetical protein